MTQRTSNQRWMDDEKLVAQWRAFADRLANPDARDIGAVLQEAAEAQLSSKATGELVDSLLDSSDVAPLLGAYVQQLLHSAAPSKITTLADLIVDFERFITQHITRAEQRADVLEQLFIDSFSRHAIMRLTPLSFRRSRVMTNAILDKVIKLVERLNAERVKLEEDIVDLRRVFHDPEGRIVHAHDRIHAVGNRLTLIYAPAHALKRENLKEASVRSHLQAIQTAITQFATMDRTAPFTDPIEIFRRMDPRVIIDVAGQQPVFRDPENHPGLIMRALGHLTRNAYDAGATKVMIKAECLPTDPVYTIAIEDDGPGIEPEKLQGLLDGTEGSGWRILRTVILPKLDAEWKIISPHQTDTQRGTLVMLFIPVVAQTSDKPDSGPVPAIHDSTTPNAELPAVHHPVSRQIAGAATCYRWPLPARVHLRLVR